MVDSITAFLMGEANRGKPLMVFDWEEAARIIKERKPRHAAAGLADDWEWTGGTIYTADGIPDRDGTYTYLSSTWATPQLEVDGEIIDCWRWQKDSPGWNAETYWPQSALDILTSIDAEVVEDARELRRGIPEGPVR